MRILVAALDSRLQAAVSAALEPEGHHLYPFRNGLDALAACPQLEPDLLLFAQDLDGIHGLELARLVRLASWKRFLPMLMFTTGEAPDRLLQHLEAGVMEFVGLPLVPLELRCRVATIARLVRLQTTLLNFRNQSEEEMAMVKHVLGRLCGPASSLTSPGFHMETLPTQWINGDACVYRESIPGVHFGMICDATGHGLMAGVSTIPVVATFLGMIERDIPLDTIYQEIHKKLLKLLPTGRFACLLLLRVDLIQGVLSVLNAGMPEVRLLRSTGALQLFPSRVLPAGIAGVDPGVVVTEAGIGPGDRILALSDGLGDLASSAELTERLLLDLAPLSHERHCQGIRELASGLAAAQEQRDDLSWALWEVPASSRRPGQTPAACTEVAADADLASGFQARFQIDPRVHPVREVLPHVLSMVMGFQVSHAQSQLLGMLLTEALTNAVEHGLLRLDSAIKSQGFEAYERHRQEALARLEAGEVSLTLTLFHSADAPSQPIRRIQVEIADTGPGFAWQSWTRPLDDPGLRPFGRGIALLSALAQGLHYNEAGNQLSFHLECP